MLFTPECLCDPLHSTTGVWGEHQPAPLLQAPLLPWESRHKPQLDSNERKIGPPWAGPRPDLILKSTPGLGRDCGKTCSLQAKSHFILTHTDVVLPPNSEFTAGQLLQNAINQHLYHLIPGVFQVIMCMGWASQVTQLVKNLPAMQGTPIQFLG